MTGSPLEQYLAAQSAEAAPVVTALRSAVTGAYDGFDEAVKYGMLMYTLDARWRTWVCAIGTTSKQVCLRFLYGVGLDDPLGVLRPGTSVLMTWDFAFDTAVDAAVVGQYVREAVDKHADHVARGPEILAAARAAGGPR